jgi:hypothetical protein
MKVDLNLQHSQDDIDFAKKRLEAQGRSLEAAIDLVIERAISQPAFEGKESGSTSSSSMKDFIVFRNNLLGNQPIYLSDEQLAQLKFEHLRDKYGQGLNLPRY